MSEDRADVLIAGGGVIGCATACCLAERGVRDVCVIDLDLQGRYASSELNAGGARATWWQEVNIAACRDTMRLFRKHQDEVSFRPCGYLWLYDDPELYRKAKERHTLQERLGLSVELLDRDDVRDRVPLLDRGMDEIIGATFSPGDGLVNPNAVRSFYRRQAESLGVRFLNRHYIEGVETTESLPGCRRVDLVHVVEVAKGSPTDDETLLERILTQHRVPPEKAVDHPSIRADLFVNALGAWSPVLSSKLGVRDVALPVRRQISMVDVRKGDLPQGFDLHTLGMVVDASGVYFHPEGPYILAGYSNEDEPSGYDFRYDGEAFFEREIWPRLAHRASAFERLGHVRGWAGLYSVTPDRSGIVGRVPGFSNVIEAHSFTGRGVMQSYGIGRGVAELVCDGSYRSLDLSPLCGDRFDDPTRWVTEDLHI
jgi:glycine/D-amino acid oxidase-like deaminating enzyme